ncbi:hypothetical protein Tco_0368015 [Tanacetum coccineum]
MMDSETGKNQNQVTNNGKLKKEVIIIDSSIDEVCDVENTLPNIEDQSSGKNPKEVTMNQKLKKTIIINDISDYEVDTVYAESRKTKEELNKKETNTDSDDEQPTIFKRSRKVPHASLQGKHKFTHIEDSDEEEGNIQNYIYLDTCYNNNNNDEDGEASELKQHKFTLLDEDTDEEEGNIQNYIYPNTWSNINDNDEDGEDLYYLDMYSIRFVSNGDKNDSFINDGTTDYDTTDDEDSDNFF